MIRSMMPEQVVNFHKKQQDNSAVSALQLIDVRTKEEFAALRAEGAVNIPLDVINRQSVELAGFDIERPIFLICRSGGRSMMACERLHSEGVGDLTNVEGGTIAWVDQNLPYESDGNKPESEP